MKALLATLVLVGIALLVLVYQQPKPVEAGGWTARTPLVGTYFVSETGSLSGADSVYLRFPKANYGIGTLVTTGDSSTSVTYSMWNMSKDCTLTVFSRSCPGGSATFVTNVSAFANSGTLPSFARGIDSLRIGNDIGTLEYTIWGMK